MLFVTALYEATVELIERLKGEGVHYAEIRFCPTLHTLRGLSENEAVSAVATAFTQTQGSSYIYFILYYIFITFFLFFLHFLLHFFLLGNMKGGILLCGLRSYPSEHSIQIAELASAWLGKGVVGLDIAGDEGIFFLNTLIVFLH